MFIRQNLVYGKLDAELGAVATTISSSALAGLVVVAAPDRVRVVLDPQGQFGVPELVDVTAHTVDATSATVVRAVEDSGRLPARVHPVGTRWAVVDTVESVPVAAIDSGVVAGGARIAVAPPEWVWNEEGEFWDGHDGSVSITSQALVDDPYPDPQPGDLVGDEAPGEGATQVGPAAWAEGEVSAAFGIDSYAEGAGTVAIGQRAHADGSNSIALGGVSNASGSNSIAIGSASAEAWYATAIGVSAGAVENYSMAIGTVAKALHEGSVALGSYSETTAVDQVHIGDRHLMSDAGRAVVSEEANVIKVVDETGWGAIVSPDANTIYFVVEDAP